MTPEQNIDNMSAEMNKGEGRQYYLLLIILLAFGLRLFRLEEQSLWWDEIATVARANVSMEALFSNLLAVRNHVPLYFVAMQWWVRLGDSAFVMRFFSVVAGTLSIPMLYRTGRLIGGRTVGLVAAFLLAISPFHIWHSQEARMYTLVTALILGLNWLLLRALRQEGRALWVGYSVLALAAVYTHYLALLILLSHYVFFSRYYRRLKPEFWRWVRSVLPVGVLFGLWGAVILMTGGFGEAAINWIEPARWFEPLLTLRTFLAGATLPLGHPLAFGLFLPFLAGTAVYLARFLGRGGMMAIETKMLLYWLLAPLLFVFLISLDYSLPQLRSVYVDRYLLYTLPALLLMTAWGLNVLRGRTPWLLPLALLLVFVPTAVSLSNLYDDDVYARENWRGMFAFLEEARGPDELLLVRSGATLPLFHYISEDVPHQILPSFLVEEAEAMYLEEELPCLLHELAGEWERIWLINATSNKDPHGFPNARNRSSDRFDAEGAYKGWLDARLPVIQEEPFTGLLLTRYELIPARRWPCAAVE